MKDIIDQLHQDHINVAKLLDLYEKNYQLLKQGGNPNYLIMRDIMKYMNCYPDVVHHPLEEVIFEKMEGIDASLTDDLKKLYREHSELDDIGDMLFDKLSTIAAGEVTSLTDLLENSEKYLQLMRNHMNLEEAEVFPAIRKHMDEIDWSKVDLGLADADDPVFGSKVNEEYKNLYQSVMSAS